MLMENLATLTTAVHPATRLSNVQDYYFSRKLKEVARLNAEGRDIISLAIGSPDMPPSQRTVERLCEVASQPEAHGYQPTYSPRIFSDRVNGMMASILCRYRVRLLNVRST